MWKKLPERNPDIIRDLYVSQGKSQGEIGEMFGCTTQAVCSFMRKYGIPSRYMTMTSKCFTYRHDPDSFKSCDSPDCAYFIGFLMADGCVTGKNGEKLDVLIHGKDRIILERLREFLKSDHPISVVREKYVAFRIVSPRLTANLAQYGIVPRKTGKEQIKNIPNEYLRDFIRGYFDGDGCISKDKGSLVFNLVCASHPFLSEIQSTLKDTCDVGDVVIGEHNRGCFRFNYKGNKQVRRIRDFLYKGASMFLPRKNLVFASVLDEA